MIGNVSRRLHVRLAAAIGLILLLWFATFGLAIRSIVKERADRHLDLERRLIALTVEQIRTDLLNDVILDHDQAVELLLQDVTRRLGLLHASFVTTSGKTFGADTPTAMQERDVLTQDFPIDYEGTNYGTLHTAKRVAVGANAAWTTFWIALVATLLLAIVLLIRRFLAVEIIEPIRFLLGSFQQTPETPLPHIRSRSAEMDELAHAFATLRASLAESNEKLFAKEKEAALVELAHQVAHDIRSPLSALNVVNNSLTEVAENKRVLLRSAINRIHDIANQLLVSNRTHGHPVTALPVPARRSEVHELATLVANLVSEKRLQNSTRLDVGVDWECSESGYGQFVDCVASDFQRALSNIIDNAVDAVREHGTVTVSLARKEQLGVVSVVDNGAGIPAHILPQLMQRGVTYGKAGGNGLGLAHAREVMTSLGGSIAIESQEGKGTTVRLSVPLASPPSWFLPHLDLSRHKVVVIVDDDPSIHHIWEKRLGPVLGPDAHILHLPDCASLHEVVAEDRNLSEEALFLIDYEFRGEAKSGLETLVDLQLPHAILVTSRSEEKATIARCVETRTKMIPKNMAAYIPIRGISGAFGDPLSAGPAVRA